jgi:hypothetical protein
VIGENAEDSIPLKTHSTISRPTITQEIWSSLRVKKSVDLVIFQLSILARSGLFSKLCPGQKPLNNSTFIELGRNRSWIEVHYAILSRNYYGSS